MESPEPALRRSKREHQPSAKAAASASLSAPAPSASRRSHRRRVTHASSPASTPASTRNSSPVRGTPSSPATSRDLAAVVVDAVGPNGQRRRLRAAAHTGTSSSVTQGVRVRTGVHDAGKMLGRYSSHDCALLCEVILAQLKRQTLAPTVLDERKSPAYIKWEPVARKMETSHKLRMTPRECQLLWKFLAYGRVPAEQEDGAKLLPDSDEEDFHKTPRQVNAEVAARAAEQKMTVVVAAPDSTAGAQGDQVVEGAKPAQDSETAFKDKADASAAEPDKEDAPEAEGESEESAVRLYPTYSLPTGAPDAWYRPFAPKDALPLTFVASRFLRRKANPLPTQSVFSQVAGSQVSSAAGVTDLKRKQPMPAVSTIAKKPKVATPTLSTPPRVYTPSSTPPPAAQRARSELEFFEIKLRQELAKTSPGSKFELLAADIQRRFGEASPEVRRQCQIQATQDVERFNREVVRVRIWQKAMGANNTKPLSALAPAPTTSAKPAPSPPHVGSAKQTNTNSAGTAVAANPTTTKNSGPTAALLAHAAAVAATAAKAKNNESANTTAPKATQEQKDETSATTEPETK
ncbi:Protein Kinase [Phytophthora cinnamomi]|uniref:Protein Kinase n=1 Tax=Phytophthora cinnamomi TaxID=4785 RepID=UPI003559E7EA|nr:Protein Kinase [Phytophthora cinnamomi]